MVQLLDSFREAELECVHRFFRVGEHVLEVGGGEGFQARRIADWGARVVSVDVSSAPRDRRHFPVWRYDGEALPFLAESFDVVFSSNTLEHVKNLDVLLDEMRRVLKPSGTMIHILPTPAWRLWTNLAHYLYVGRLLTGSSLRLASGVGQVTLANRARGKTLGSAFKSVLLAPPHGEYPNALAELYYFSRSRWTKVFERHDLAVLSACKTGLFYTGYVSFPQLSLRARRFLSSILGSAGDVFILRGR